jgi:hypothetical protein
MGTQLMGSHALLIFGHLADDGIELDGLGRGEQAFFAKPLDVVPARPMSQSPYESAPSASCCHSQQSGHDGSVSVMALWPCGCCAGEE